MHACIAAAKKLVFDRALRAVSGSAGGQHYMGGCSTPMGVLEQSQAIRAAAREGILFRESFGDGSGARDGLMSRSQSTSSQTSLAFSEVSLDGAAMVADASSGFLFRQVGSYKLFL